jgi:hypothetical protein
MKLHPLVATEEMTCVACPEQWEGTLRDGRHFYFRYRGGRASLGLGIGPESAVDDPHEARVRHGDSLQGIFGSDDDRRAVFAELLAYRLESS